MTGRDFGLRLGALPAALPNTRAKERSYSSCPAGRTAPRNGALSRATRRLASVLLPNRADILADGLIRGSKCRAFQVLIALKSSVACALVLSHHPSRPIPPGERRSRLRSAPKPGRGPIRETGLHKPNV